MPYVIILIVVVLLRTFIITPIIVNGESMNPTLKEKQILILNKYDKKYNRGDIVVVNYINREKEERLIKRVMGLPGEKVEYNENKLQTAIQQFLNPKFYQITQAIEIDKDTALNNCINILEYFKDSKNLE